MGERAKGCPEFVQFFGSRNCICYSQSITIVMYSGFVYRHRGSTEERRACQREGCRLRVSRDRNEHKAGFKEFKSSHSKYRNWMNKRCTCDGRGGQVQHRPVPTPVKWMRRAMVIDPSDGTRGCALSHRGGQLRQLPYFRYVCTCMTWQISSSFCRHFHLSACLSYTRHGQDMGQVEL